MNLKALVSSLVTILSVVAVTFSPALTDVVSAHPQVAATLLVVANLLQAALPSIFGKPPVPPSA